MIGASASICGLSAFLSALPTSLCLGSYPYRLHPREPWATSALLAARVRRFDQQRRRKSTADSSFSTGRAASGLYEPALAESERDAVAELLGYLENVHCPEESRSRKKPSLTAPQRTEVDFFAGEPLRALSTLVYSENVDLQRSASLTFAEITEHGTWMATSQACANTLLTPRLRCTSRFSRYPRAHPLPPPIPRHRSSTSCKCRSGQPGSPTYVSSGANSTGNALT